MPTAERRAFVPGAITVFLAQGRDDAEFLILDDGADLMGDLVPPDTRVHWFRQLPWRRLGAKCRVAHRHARHGLLLFAVVATLAAFPALAPTLAPARDAGWAIAPQAW